MSKNYLVPSPQLFMNSGGQCFESPSIKEDQIKLKHEGSCSSYSNSKQISIIVYINRPAKYVDEKI